ncbi:hypothetical protein BJV74DRAFT_799018 [Russula compacta]|nr:hypothetical protein BJV74DRAFT_799018 [Russula compacta]
MQKGRLNICIHPYLDSQPCDKGGYDLLPGTPPPPFPECQQDDYEPYDSQADFELAYILYHKEQMSSNHIDELMEIWATYHQAQYDDDDNPQLPFANAQDFYNVINATEARDVPWRHLLLHMMIGNHNFGNEIDYTLKQVFSQTWTQQFCDLMSGDWASEQADIIAKNSEAHGAMFAPVILGSDKTTVSVATGHNKYYPLYAGIRNAQNHVRVSCHSKKRIIYGVGPYIADYPEQALLACVFSGWCPKSTSNHTNLDNDPSSVPQMHAHTDMLRKAYSDNIRGLWNGYGVPFTTHFPRADIHKLLAPNLLHQIIKGTFKDHLVTWVMDYVAAEHGTKDTNQILNNIDRWCSQIDEMTLELINAAIECFHQKQEIFIEVGVWEDFSLPQQHSLVHYSSLIHLFGMPNGICSSITESKHIKAIKEPWHCSNCNQPLGQILLTNQHALPSPQSPPLLAPNEDDDEAVDAPGMTALGDVKLAANPAKLYPKTLGLLTGYVAEPRLPEYIQWFLYDQLYPNVSCWTECGSSVDISVWQPPWLLVLFDDICVGDRHLGHLLWSSNTLLEQLWVVAVLAAVVLYLQKEEGDLDVKESIWILKMHIQRKGCLEC